MVAVRERRIRTLRFLGNGTGGSAAPITSPDDVYGVSTGGKFVDSFTRADAAAIGGNWTVVGGSFSIVSNELKAGTTYSLARVTTALGGLDMEVELTIGTAGSSPSRGVMARSNTGMSNAYFFRNDGVSWDLFHVLGGAFTAIGSPFAGAAAAGDVMKLKVVGTTIEGYVNGVLRCSATDSVVTTNGGQYAGVRLAASATSTYDNFSATTVPFGGVPTSYAGEAALEGSGILIALDHLSTGGGASRTHMYDRLWVSGSFVTHAGIPVDINSPALPARDVNGSSDGEGLLVYSMNPGSTATGPLTVSYTNSAGVAGRTGTVTSPTVSAFARMEMQAGDTGVRSVETVTNAATTTTAIKVGIFRRLGVLDAFDLDSNNLARPTRDDPLEVRLLAGTVLQVSPNAFAGSQRVAVYAAHVAMD